MNEPSATGSALAASPVADLPPELLDFPARGQRRRDLDAALAAFYTEESAALDERRFDDWLGFLAEEFIYQVPVPLLREDPALPRHSATAMLFEATKQVLRMKLTRTGLQHAWSDRPGGNTRHFVGAVRVFCLPETQLLRADCNVLATLHRGWDESALATTARQDVIRQVGADEYQVVRRRVLLDAELATCSELSIIF